MKNSVAYKLIKKSVASNWYYIVALIVLSVFVAGISSVSPLFYKKILDESIPQKDLHSLIFYVFIMAIIPLINTLLSNIRNKAGFFFSDKCSRKIRRACFENVMSMNYPTFEELGSQKLMNTITRTIGKITELYLYSDFVNLVTNAVQLIVIFIILQSFSLKITLAVFIVIPVLYIFIKLLANKTGKSERDFINNLNKCEKFLLQCFYGMKTVRAYNGQNSECEYFEDWLKENARLGWKVKSTNNLVRLIIPQSISQIVLGVLFVLCASFVMNEKMSIGTLVAIIAYVPTLISSINGLLSIQVGKSAISKMIPDLDAILTAENEYDARQISDISLSENIAEFNNVEFSYGRGDFSLKIDNLKIERGDFVAIVGTSGGGKTSILDILNKFYPIKSGNITILNTELSSVNPNKLRDKIACVFQDVFVFNKTIAENISYPEKPDAEKIKEVVRLTKLTEFIDSLPEKENSIISDFGSNFSGGECQRIALARALYKNSDILLLDEPTAALDAVTSEYIINTLKTYCKNKTIIMITHDIGKALLASKAVVIENGNLVECGSPSELLKEHGKFNQLYEAHQHLKDN
ncbi:MAG: ABC transporter ATP-binding protein/permease [Clostridiales bacterium]|nr:ABC transporter ATP-binding protein/permease [Clostridiales bacterium]